jgi:myo-inositol-1-phosphate synthase
MIDAIRGAKLALDRDISGLLKKISAYCFKHTTAIQMPFSSYNIFIEFVKGKRERNYNFY